MHDLRATTARYLAALLVDGLLAAIALPLAAAAAVAGTLVGYPIAAMVSSRLGWDEPGCATAAAVPAGAGCLEMAMALAIAVAALTPFAYPLACAATGRRTLGARQVGMTQPWERERTWSSLAGAALWGAALALLWAGALAALAAFPEV